MFEYRGRQLDFAEDFEEYFEEKIWVKLSELEIDAYLKCTSFLSTDSLNIFGMGKDN